MKIEEFHSGTHDRKKILAKLQPRLPLDIFRTEGFGILSITDVTPAYSIGNIEDLILKRSSYEGEKCHSHVINYLNVLVGGNDIEFGLLPLIQVNDKLVFDNAACLNRKLKDVAYPCYFEKFTTDGVEYDIYIGTLLLPISPSVIFI